MGLVMKSRMDRPFTDVVLLGNEIGSLTKPLHCRVFGPLLLSFLSKTISTIRRNPMGSKIYVGGLPYSTTEAQLNELFTPHGTVESARVITDKFTGQSRGFGFVEMSTEDEAKKAIGALNSTQLDGRTLMVNEAKPQEARSGGKRSDSGSRW